MKMNILTLITFLGFSINYNCIYGQTTLILQPSSIEGKDAHINSNFPRINYGSNQGLYSAAWTWSSSYGTVRSFIQFDLSSVPTDANIVSAKLSLYNDPVNNLVLTDGEHSNLTASNASIISRVTESWEETDINWNNQPGYDTTNQVFLEESTSSNQDYLDINVLDMVQEMIEDPSENHGFVLRLQTEINYTALIFASSDDIDSTNHPKLEIEYSIPHSIGGELQNSTLVNIFPNPVKDEINIDLNNKISNLTVTLFNSTGQMLLNENFRSNNSIKLNLDVPSGIYYLQLQTPTKIIETVKVLKE